MTTSKDRIWESIEDMSGNFCGFIYHLRKLTEGMWRADASFKVNGKTRTVIVVGQSPGETLTALADQILSVSPVK